MKNISIVVFIFLVIFILVVSEIDNSRGRVYDCGMAEWHPDIPLEVKEQCRKLHYEDWKNQQEQNKKKLINT